MKILVYRGKHGDVYFDATDSASSAFLAMFNYIDKLNYYGADWIPSFQWPLVEKARNGDRTAAHHLLRGGVTMNMRVGALRQLLRHGVS